VLDYVTESCFCRQAKTFVCVQEPVQNFDWVSQHSQLKVHASTTHPDELLLLPELFEELLPEPLEEELEELPEAGDLLDGAMTPEVFVDLC
jgi:hypothetical protein